MLHVLDYQQCQREEDGGEIKDIFLNPIYFRHRWSLIFLNFLSLKGLAWTMTRTQDWQASISHHRPKFWLQAGMRGILTSAASEGRTPREAKFVFYGWKMLTRASASFLLPITEGLDVILMLQKPLRSGLSLPPFALFALPVYSSWQKIICDHILSLFVCMCLIYWKKW